MTRTRTASHAARGVAQLCPVTATTGLAPLHNTGIVVSVAATFAGTDKQALESRRYPTVETSQLHMWQSPNTSPVEAPKT